MDAILSMIGLVVIKDPHSWTIFGGMRRILLFQVTVSYLANISSIDIIYYNQEIKKYFKKSKKCYTQIGWIFIFLCSNPQSSKPEEDSNPCVHDSFITLHFCVNVSMVGYSSLCTCLKPAFTWTSSFEHCAVYLQHKASY